MLRHKRDLSSQSSVCGLGLRDNLKANAPKYSNLSREAQGLKYVIVIEPESLALEV